MKKINHFKTAKLATNKPAPKIIGKMTVFYPGEKRIPPKIIHFNDNAPSYSAIGREVQGRPERIQAFKSMWRSDDVHDERKVPAIAYGHHEGRVNGMELNHDASEIWFDQDAYNDWTAKFIQAQGRYPERYALFGPIVVLTGTRAFLNRV